MRHYAPSAFAPEALDSLVLDADALDARDVDAALAAPDVGSTVGAVCRQRVTDAELRALVTVGRAVYAPRLVVPPVAGERLAAYRGPNGRIAYLVAGPLTRGRVFDVPPAYLPTDATWRSPHAWHLVAHFPALPEVTA